jgi:4-hydroxythreonine-4-phosphate dehydrogenase
MSKALALTLGEPAGIGPDIAIAAWLKRREFNLPAFYLIGDSAFVKARASALNAPITVSDIKPEDASAAFPDTLPTVKPGLPPQRGSQPDDSSAPSAIASIRRAVADVIEQRASAVVTNHRQSVLDARVFASGSH